MVCLGNICRSPMAEGVLRERAARAGHNLHIDSAGTSDYHIGEGPDRRAVHCMKSYGIDISGLRARQFVSSDFDAFDTIFVMDQQNYRDVLSLARHDDDARKVSLFLNQAYPGENRSVPDPWFGGPEGFHDVYAMLDRASRAFLESTEI